MNELHDMHCHLDFMANGEDVARDAAHAGSLIFAATVTPDGYDTARERFGEFENVRVGAGLHPWWVRDGTDTERLAEMAEGARFIGEVGLDFGKRYELTRASQVEAFRAITRACGAAGGKVLSIHAVRSAREVLDELSASDSLENCTCIFHWYSGPSDQLKRAIDAGCLFSVNVRMLATKKGREYVKAIPTNQLLLETDAPPGQGVAYSWDSIHGELALASAQIEAIRGSEAIANIAENARRVMR